MSEVVLGPGAAALNEADSNPVLLLLASVRESQDTWTKNTVNFLTVAKEKIKKRREAVVV